MGSSVKQEDTLILMPISSFSGLTKKVAQGWIKYGNKAAAECMNLYPSIAEAFFYQYSTLITSLRNDTTEKSIPECDRCTHLLLMLAATSSLGIITQEMQNQSTNAMALKNIEQAEKNFYNRNPGFMNATDIKKKGLPNAKTVYAWFTENNNPPWAVTERVNWVEETYKPPIKRGAIAVMFRQVIRECLLGHKKTATNILVSNRRKFPEDVTCDRRDYSSRPVPPDNVGAIQQSSEPRSLRHH